MKVLILGSNPSKKGGHSPSIGKLKLWLDVLGLNIVSFCNVANTYGPVNLKDIKHDYLREICPRYDKIITLGKTANYAMVLMGFSHYSLPHPSGLNRQLNNSEFLNEKLKECRDYLWT